MKCDNQNQIDWMLKVGSMLLPVRGQQDGCSHVSSLLDHIPQISSRSWIHSTRRLNKDRHKITQSRLKPFNWIHLKGHTSSRMTVVGEPMKAMAELTLRLFPPLEDANDKTILWNQLPSLVFTTNKLSIMTEAYLRFCTSLSRNSFSLKASMKSWMLASMSVPRKPLSLANSLKLCSTVRNSGK